MGKTKSKCICNISGKLCPLSADEWAGGLARDIAKDNCPARGYTPDDQIMKVDGNIIKVHNDYCKHLAPQ